MNYLSELNELGKYMWVVAAASMAFCGLSMMFNGYADRTEKAISPLLKHLGNNWWPVRRKRELWKLLVWLPAATLYVVGGVLYLVLLPIIELFLWWWSLPN